jgi:uncharacterized protein YecE (DUF72 family)
MAARREKVFIGCSGFSYNHWKGGVFYPEGVPQRKWLEYYSENFDTVELNVTFYRLPADTTFTSWRTRTPDRFRFVCKGSKLITHIKQLKDTSELVDQFMDRVGLLEEKRGPVLWQLKPRMAPNLKTFKSFVKHLKKYKGTQHAFEFRDPRWFDERVYGIIAEAGMSVVRADMPHDLPEPPDEFPFIYVRRHGPEKSAYRGSYPDKMLEEDANDIRRWRRSKKEVYEYFNNDIGGHAPRNALKLRELVKKKR